jgi:hypothetical protein
MFDLEDKANQSLQTSGLLAQPSIITFSTFFDCAGSRRTNCRYVRGNVWLE